MRVGGRLQDVGIKSTLGDPEKQTEFLSKWDKMHLKIIARQKRMGTSWDPTFYLVTEVELEAMMNELDKDPIVVENIAGYVVGARTKLCKRPQCGNKFITVSNNSKFCCRNCSYVYHKHRAMEMRKLYTKIRKEAKASGNPYSIDIEEVLRRVDKLLKKI